MGATLLRLATVADIGAMHELRLSVVENRLSDPRRIGYEHYREMLQERGRGWVHEVEGTIAGFAVADQSRRNIWALFVAPGFQRRGVGRALHDAMVAWLFERSREPLWLNTERNTRAENFYATAGWRRTGVEVTGELRFELAHEDYCGRAGP
jgi:GNAT superfamily N-acetyltransferase